AIGAVQEAGTSLEAIIAAHGVLAKIVAPATPCSLEATEPVRGPLGFLRNPPLIKWMIATALVSAFLFILATAFAAPDQVAAQISATRWPNELLKQLNWLAAAALGATFYALFTAHEYVKNRTFDPKYNSIYLIRFILGVVAGLILGNVGPHLPGVSDTSNLQTLGTAVLALLGGFSAEAVNQILQRVVDVVLAAVMGGHAAAA